MFELSPLKLILVAFVILVLFGKGKVAGMMGEFGKGVKNFKEGMNDEANRPVSPPPSQIAAQPAATTPAAPVTPPTATAAETAAAPADHQA